MATVVSVLGVYSIGFKRDGWLLPYMGIPRYHVNTTKENKTHTHCVAYTVVEPLS